MNKIKFRGKDVETGKWVYGYYFYSKKEDKHYICFEKQNEDLISYSFNKVVVDPATVGQCTWKKDKNGIEIYTGDVIRGTDEWNGYDITEIVKYDEVYASYGVENEKDGIVDLIEFDEIEIITEK